ncbi:MAG TPA: sulfatase-like hydrolase/transferase, partial [Labilithrix sp.]|nr:sulfatase-like hydrolase/transferase [Labilithrix sp.]
GVLRRAELDLRPVVHAGILVVGTWGIGAGLEHARCRLSSPANAGSRAQQWRAVSTLAAVIVLSAAALLVRSASWLTAAPEIATTLRLHAPLGALSLATLQRASDRDGDGYSAWFGGGDCNDGDRSINPAAMDVPGNGIDEDCSGLDTPLTQPEDSAPARLTLHPNRPYNVVLISIDALRFDLGFMGHPRAISPNLDALAAKGTVFEHAYAMASMTWQSLGSLLIGKYPSEIAGYERFNHFAPENVLVTERLREAGVRTFAAMCQFAFSKPRPMDVPRDAFAHIGHGFDIWDTSADPDPNGFNFEDDAITSDKLTNAAITLLSNPENVTPPSGRFFAWFHYFDTHTQYVLHPEAPDFATSDTSEVGRDRAVYESEVWFTDHHVGRLIDFFTRQPWGKDTAIIVTGDHGEAFNEHGMRWHRKELWEELVHVPLIAYVPGQTPNRVSARRSHIDLARTILELTGVPAPDDGSLRGESLLADALAPPGHVPAHRPIYAEIVPSEGPIRRVLISGPGRGMKLIHRGGTAYELYDLDVDPGEKKNLAANRARLGLEVERLQKFRGGLKEVPWRGRAK